MPLSLFVMDCVDGGKNKQRKEESNYSLMLVLSIYFLDILSMRLVQKRRVTMFTMQEFYKRLFVPQKPVLPYLEGLVRLTQVSIHDIELLRSNINWDLWDGAPNASQ